MAVSPNTFRYIFELSGKQLFFEVNTSSEPDQNSADDRKLPEWTKLDNHRCGCCPLKPETFQYCPAAVRMHEVLEKFESFDSVEEVKLSVETERRTYVQSCDMQSGLNSMIGLMMATSGCPVVGELRSMASFHLPYSTFVETLYRSLGAYLTKQYFIKQSGGDADWSLDGLKAFYEDLEILNQDFSERIRSITEKDAILNALIIFFSTSAVVASAVEDDLEEYRDYFTGKSATPPA